MWSPAIFIINNNAKVLVLMNLFNVTVFKTKIKRERERERTPKLYFARIGERERERERTRKLSYSRIVAF